MYDVGVLMEDSPVEVVGCVVVGRWPVSTKSLRLSGHGRWSTATLPLANPPGTMTTE
jgi:hypothetical protein